MALSRDSVVVRVSIGTPKIVIAIKIHPICLYATEPINVVGENLWKLLRDDAVLLKDDAVLLRDDAVLLKDDAVQEKIATNILP